MNNVVKVHENSENFTGIHSTLRPARKVLNNLHTLMSLNGYNEIYIHQCSNDVFMIIRQNPNDGSSYVLITRTAYWNDDNPVSCFNMKLPGIIEKIEFLGVLSFRN